MVVSSIKKINRLISKGMSNIYLKVTFEKNWRTQNFNFVSLKNLSLGRGGSRTAATSKMELFVIVVDGFLLLTIITKCSILSVAAVLDPPLFRSAFWRTPTHTVIIEF